MATVLYVDLNSTNPTLPYTNWLTAATNIQDAVDAATAGDTVLVTNGVYQTGARKVNDGNAGIWWTSNRVVVAKDVTVASVNGASFSSIVGFGQTGETNAVRCVYLTNGASLVGFTLTGGATQQGGYGGGAYCKSNGTTLVNCVLSNNFAYYGAGAYAGTLFNCVIVSNLASTPGNYGGGVSFATLSNCTISGNVANMGGGAYACTLSDCIISGNRAVNLGGGTSGGHLYNCTISNNSAGTGGGAYFGTFDHCLIVSNSTGIGEGGGVYAGAVTNSTIAGNSASLGGGSEGGNLYGCTLMNNYAKTVGGAAYQNNLYNCTLVGNSAKNGGGSYMSTLYNCILTGNFGTNGGGANSGNLYNCTLVGNTATNGGGAYQSSLYNCIVFYNTAVTGSNYSGATLRHCCTAPFSAGDDNITNSPGLTDLKGSDFHLQASSACINAGNNGYVSNSFDFAGELRIRGGTVDIGAYEFQTPTSVISYDWLQQYGLPVDGAADYVDADLDGMISWQEWIAGTNPTNAASLLKLMCPVPTNSPPRILLSWQSVSNRIYYIQRCTNLSLSVFSSIRSNLTGQSGSTTFADTTATNATSYFYRVGVQQ